MNIPEILRDFIRRYDQSYLWVMMPDSDEESLFFVNRITEDRKNVAVLELSSPEYGKILLNMGTSHTLRFKYPPVGVFQNGKDAFIFRRVPARQYKVGLYHGNSSIEPVWSKMLGSGGEGGALQFDQVLAAYQGVQYTYSDAVKMLATGKYRSIALRRGFSLCLSTIAKEGYVLLFWETPVANVDSKGEITHLYEKSFESLINQVKEA